MLCTVVNYWMIWYWSLQLYLHILQVPPSTPSLYYIEFYCGPRARVNFLALTPLLANARPANVDNTTSYSAPNPPRALPQDPAATPHPSTLDNIVPLSTLDNIVPPRWYSTPPSVNAAKDLLMWIDSTSNSIQYLHLNESNPAVQTITSPYG